MYTLQTMKADKLLCCY